MNDADGITPLDALMLINYINAHPGEAALPASPGTSPPYYDVSGDDACSAMDVLQIINRINELASGGGEGEAIPAATASSERFQTVTADWVPWPNLSDSSPAADPADPPTLQRDFEKPSRSASYWPPANEASEAVSRDTSGQGMRRETHDQESPFDREIDFTELEAVLSDIGQDVGKAWKQP